MSTEKQLSINFSDKGDRPVNVAGRICTPAVIAGGILLCFCYIADIALSGRAETGIGETSVLARILFDTASFINSLIYPLISIGIAVSVSGTGALGAGFVGGMLAGTGANLITTNENITGISGLFGSIAAGFIAGYSQKLADRFFSKKGKSADYAHFLSPTVAIIITSFSIFGVNTVSFYINHLSSVLLGITAKANGLLVSLLLGIFMTADSGGPLYLAGYIFGVASITTGEPQYMASVIAGGAVPPICMGLYTLIYNESTDKRERFTGVLGILGGLSGVSQFAVPYYTQKSYRFVFSCIPGGIIASMLSFALRCSCAIPAGGILAFSSSGKPLFLLTAIIFGGLVSTFILSTFENTDEQESAQDKTSSVKVNTAV